MNRIQRDGLCLDSKTGEHKLILSILLILQHLACFTWFAVKRCFPKPGGKLFVAFVTFCKPLCLNSEAGAGNLTG